MQHVITVEGRSLIPLGGRMWNKVTKKMRNFAGKKEIVE